MRTKSKMLIIYAVVICLILILIPACTGKPDTTKEPKEILIGAVPSLTGMFAGFGQGSAWGLQAAIDDVNAEGGVYLKEYGAKVPLKLIVVNSESNPIKVASLAEDLILSDKVNFLTIGGEPPTTTSAASNTADKYKVLFVSCCGPYEPWKALRDASPTNWKYTWACGTFSIATPAPSGDFRDQLGYTIIDAWKIMLDKYGDQTNKKMAVFASDDADGVGWYGLFPEVAKTLGYEIIGAEKQLGLMPVDTTDFSATINEWKKNNCEILWGNAPAPFCGALWKQCATLGFQPKIATLGRGVLFYEDVADWGDLLQGITTELYWHPAWENSPGFGNNDAKTIDQRWNEATGRYINSGMADGYRSIQAIVDGLERAGTLDTDKLWNGFKESDFMSVAHRVKYDETQFNRGALVLGQWQQTSPGVWELKVVGSQVDFVKTTGTPIFPIPYK